MGELATNFVKEPPLAYRLSLGPIIKANPSLDDLVCQAGRTIMKAVSLGRGRIDIDGVIDVMPHQFNDPPQLGVVLKVTEKTSIIDETPHFLGSASSVTALWWQDFYDRLPAQERRSIDLILHTVHG